jgi:hypothetical protein
MCQRGWKKIRGLSYRIRNLNSTPTRRGFASPAPSFPYFLCFAHVVGVRRGQGCNTAWRPPGRYPSGGGRRAAMVPKPRFPTASATRPRERPQGTCCRRPARASCSTCNAHARAPRVSAWTRSRSPEEWRI